MGRSTENSFKVIARYLQQRKLPATLNDMVEANIMSRSTLFRLLRPELFPDAALYGIKVLTNTKPFFFTYDSDLQMDMLTKSNEGAANLIENHKDALIGAANRVAANAIILDDIESKIIDAVRKHRADPSMAEKNQTLLDNFAKAVNPENTLIAIDNPEVRGVLLSDITKFRTFLISAYVASFNEE